MSKSDWRSMAVDTEVALLLLPPVVSKVATCEPKATEAPKLSVLMAPAPVIEVNSGGVICTLMAADPALAMVSVVQSMFPAFKTQFVPALTGPTINGVVTPVEVNEMVDRTLRAVSGPLFAMV